MASNYYVSSVAYAAVAQWAANTAYSLGQYVRQLAAPAEGSERVFKCTTAGTTGASEPSWSLNNNATTVSGTATFTQVAGQEANQSAGNWTAPAASIKALRAAITILDDTVFVSSDHSETSTAAATISGTGGCLFISVSRTGASLPPTAADYAAGAVINTTGASNLTLGSSTANETNFKGFTFNIGSGSSSASFNGGGSGGLHVLEDCAINLTNTNINSAIFPSSSSTFCQSLKLRNCTITFGSTSQGINSTNPGSFEMIGGSIAQSGSVPSAIIKSGSSNGLSSTLLDGVDLSACSGSVVSSNFSGQVRVVNCKLHASLSFPASSSALTPTVPFAFASLEYSDSSSGNLNYRYIKSVYGGKFQTYTAVYRTGGASDGTVSYSWRLDQDNTGDKSIYQPVISDWISRYNTLTGSKTVTVEIVTFVNSTPTNNMHWLEVVSLDDSGVPQGTVHSSRQDNPLSSTSNLTTSTEAWDAGATSRANSTAYAVGDIIKVSSNTGRVFICSTAGTSSGSLPAGYASAVDGGSVTDGTATFRAGYRCKLSVTINPARAGILRARVCTRGQLGVSNADRRVAFIDPKLAVA